jgi:hypothetical protein
MRFFISQLGELWQVIGPRGYVVHTTPSYSYASWLCDRYNGVS